MVAVLFNAPKAVDLSTVATDQAISMWINLVAKPTGAVNVGINCENDSNCATNVDISPALNVLEINAWSQISVATSCFTQAGVDLSAVTNAFSLSSADSVNIILSEIGYTEVTDTTLTCQ